MTQDTAVLAGGLADRSAWRTTQCPVGRALDVVGTRSAMLLLREAYYGTTRFDDFAERVRISDAVAAARLRELTEAGLFAKVPYREEGSRTRYEYVLTTRGRQLFPVLVSLIEFGMLLQGDARRLDLVHGDGCGAPLITHVQCTGGHHVQLAQSEVRIRPKHKR